VVKVYSSAYGVSDDLTAQIAAAHGYTYRGANMTAQGGRSITFVKRG
jgi:hypothetical protein